MILAETITYSCGRIPERPKGADCKSAVNDFGGSNPPPPTKDCLIDKTGSLFVLSDNCDILLKDKNEKRFIS